MVEGKRNAANIVEGCHLVEKLERMLPEHARRHLKPGIFGDADAAWSLAAAAGEYRGYVALAAYWCGTPLPAYREILSTIWDLSHGSILDATRGKCGLVTCCSTVSLLAMVQTHKQQIAILLQGHKVRNLARPVIVVDNVGIRSA